MELTLEQKKAIAIASAKAKAKKAASPPDAPAAAGSKPLSYPDMMKQSIVNVGKGMMTGGLPGAGVATLQEANRNLDAILSRGSYNAGGAVTDSLAPHVSPEVAAGLGTAANILTQAVPVVAGTVLGGATITPAMQKGARFSMHSALKPKAKTLEKGDKAVQTMLDYGINVSRGGYKKLQKAKDALLNAIDARIGPATGTINAPRNAAPYISDTMRKFNSQVDPTADVKAVKNVWDSFSRRYARPMSVQEAQKVKTTTNQLLKDRAYGELKNADTEAQKAIVRSLKDAIEQNVPDVKPLNKSLGEIYNLEPSLGGRIGIAENANPIGIAALAGNPNYQAAMLADRSSFLKSLVARALYSGSKPVGKSAGAMLGLAYGKSKGEE